MMEPGESSSVYVPAEFPSAQAQKDLLELFQKLIDLSGEMIHVQKLPEVRGRLPVGVGNAI